MNNIPAALVVVLFAAFSSRLVAADEPAKIDAAQHEIVTLWPGTAPGEKGDIGEEKDTTPGQDIIRLTNVSKPTITLFRPAADKDTGAAVIVCPGGGYNILAYNLEGSEV
ncbi:MAG TPA: hypothetical protein VGY55_12765, partial [Pirellulales bacterium]|nr:hypothetical protein [Pirellulales bacterium]